MERTNNIRRKKVGSNLDQFKTDPNEDSNTTSTAFSEEIKDTHHRLEDIWKNLGYFGLLFSMLADSFNKKYPVPKKTVLVMTFAFLYLISPVDFIPDIIPLLGFADDIALFAFVFGLIKEDLERYRTWKISY